MLSIVSITHSMFTLCSAVFPFYHFYHISFIIYHIYFLVWYHHGHRTHNIPASAGHRKDPECLLIELHVLKLWRKQNHITDLRMLLNMLSVSLSGLWINAAVLHVVFSTIGAKEHKTRNSEGTQKSVVCAELGKVSSFVCQDYLLM